MNIKRIKGGISYLKNEEFQEVLYNDMYKKATANNLGLDDPNCLIKEGVIKGLDNNSGDLKRLASNYLEVPVNEIDIIE